MININDFTQLLDGATTALKGVGFTEREIIYLQQNRSVYISIVSKLDPRSMSDIKEKVVSDRDISPIVRSVAMKLYDAYYKES